MSALVTSDFCSLACWVLQSEERYRKLTEIEESGVKSVYFVYSNTDSMLYDSQRHSRIVAFLS